MSDLTTQPRNDRNRVRLLIITVLGLFSIVQVFPLIWVVDFSLLKSNQLFGGDLLIWPNPPQWQNFVVAWNQGNIPRYFFNSVVVTLADIGLVILISLTSGYAFTRMEWKWRKTIFAVTMLGMMIPVYATLLPNFLIFRRIGLLDNYFGLIVPYVSRLMPIGVFIMSGFMVTIPKSLEESAVMDGANVYTIIFRIIAPLTKPAVISISIMTFLHAWNDFIMAATYLTSDTFKTLPFSVINFANAYSSDYAKQFAVMVLASLPSLIVFIALSKRITKGVMMGAIKG